MPCQPFLPVRLLAITSPASVVIIERRRKIKELTIQKRRLAHHRQAA